ncbi:MAG: YjgN family protein [Methylococcaceae bacterium]
MLDRQQLHFEFSGRGGEYFKIWIVNTCLSIITLGIYSAWAKVRRNQYFYRHTQLAGASFDYHGDPKAILKGRIIAFVLFGSYSLLNHYNPVASLVVLLLILLILPWLLVRSLRFRLHNTSYRGLRFAFLGDVKHAFIDLMLLPLLSMLTLGLLWPFAQRRMIRYIRNQSAYGNVLFNFNVSIGRLYGIYGMVFLYMLFMFAGTFGVSYLCGSYLELPDKFAGQLISLSAMVAAMVTYLALLALFYSYVQARMQNLIWQHTLLGEHRFGADMKASKLLGILFSNLLLIVISLGFYKPYAEIRLARYRLEHIHLIANGNLDDFVTGIQGQVTAVGEEITDMFDFDVAL